MIDPASGDLMVKDGQIVVGPVDGQCIEQIIVSNRGEYKEHPLVGGEVIRMMHGEESRFWANRVRNMCIAMGVAVKRVSLDINGKITVEQ